MDAAVLTEGLTKFYGQNRAVADLGLAVRPGEVFGYLGPNGAGKTTTIRLLLDLIRPSSGRAWVLGLDAQRESIEVRRRVGYLPGELAFWPQMTGREFLRYLAGLRGGVDRTYTRTLAERLNLDLSRPIHTLSRGNKQKLGLVQAFMHRPELLILDEPTSGLDPIMQHEFNGLVREVRAQGATVFISSHVLSEVEALCDRVGIIRDGSLITVEEVVALKEQSLRRVEVRFAGPVDPADLAGIPALRHVSLEGERLTATVSGGMGPFVRALARFEVRDLLSREPSLEEVFLTYYEGSNHEA